MGKFNSRFTKTSILLVIVVLLFTSCTAVREVRQVRQSDLDVWVGMPVEALDIHSFFLTVPLVKTISDSGIEIRNYRNGGKIYSKCTGYVDRALFATCMQSEIVCNNLFYIKDKIVLEYAPTGRCYTDDHLRPEERYKRLLE
tara:strand:- start:328 stop:753 length:426 start_codon:yes stop_codon:yes gene_type:complete